jgi:hypothetical protein
MCLIGMDLRCSSNVQLSGSCSRHGVSLSDLCPRFVCDNCGDVFCPFCQLDDTWLEFELSGWIIHWYKCPQCAIGLGFIMSSTPPRLEPLPAPALPGSSAPMGPGNLQEALKELAQQQKKVADALEKSSPKPKDAWDKFSAVSTFLATVVIAALGSVLTVLYNWNESNRSAALKKQDQDIARIQTIEKFMPHLNGSEQEKRLAILVISSLGDTDLATKLAALYPSQGTINALKSIATSGQQEDRNLASSALQSIFDQQRKAVVQVVQDGTTEPFASGAIVTSSGHVITADYVATWAGRNPRVVTADNLIHKADIIAVDKKRGLAVLKIEASTYPSLHLANQQVKPGDSVLAIGTRGKLLLEPATGLVKGTDQRFVTVAFSSDIQGFGGGPVLNDEGLLIAIVYDLKPDTGAERLDQCIGSNVLREYLVDLKISPFASK